MIEFNSELSNFLNGKTEQTLRLFRFFVAEFEKISPIEIRVTKTMIALKGNGNEIYITQLGKNFVHIVFPFNQRFDDNFCFIKIAQVPSTQQFNHHLRIYNEEDVNEEVKTFMNMRHSG